MATLLDLPRRLVIGLIRFYQLAISPALGPRCRFYPSCSHYTVEALRVHGLVRGLGLGGWRILRCHPFTPGGFDPVPPPRKSQPQGCVGPCPQGDRAS